MGKHNKESRRNYLKRRRKMLKERKEQNKDSTSQFQENEEESTCPESIAEEATHKKSRSDKCQETVKAQYRTLGDLPPELQFDPMKDNLYFSFVNFFENKRKLQKLIENPLGDH